VTRASVVVGRETELEELRGAVRNARDRRATCVFIVGEGGIGKTRLLTETGVFARRRNLAVMSGRAPIATPAPFGVVADALRSWLRAHSYPASFGPFDRGLALVLPEWPVLAAGTNTGAGGVTGAVDAAQLRLLALEGVVQLMRKLAQDEHGVVVLLDDLQSADPESLEAVRYLANAGVDGLTLVGALRPDESTLADEVVRSLRRDGATEVVALASLGEREVGQLVAALLDSDPPAELVADIAARTDGVPLLVEEVFLAHVRAGTIDSGDGGTVWRGGVPSVPRTIRDLVGARLDGLDRGERNVIVAGAVVGDFEPALMTAVAASDDAAIAEALAAGVRVGLLETTGGAIAFRHAIIREAALDATVPHLIDTMHRRAAAALDAESSQEPRRLERKARHLAAANEDDGAACALVAAAECWLTDHALLAAEQSALDALARARDPSTRAAAADMLARSLAAQGRWTNALDRDAATVAEHGATPPRQHRMAICAIEAGQPERAEPVIETALASGDTAPLLLLADGRVALVRGDAKHALDRAAQVRDPEFRTGLDDRLAALDLAARALDYLGDREGAEAAWGEQASEAAAGGRTQAQLRAVVQLGKVELFAGRTPKRLHEAVDLASEMGALIELSWAQENLAIGLCTHGDIPAALVVLDEAVARCRALRLDQLAYLLAARAMIASYITADIEEQLAEAEALAPTTDLTLHTASMRADIALRDHRYDDAIHWLEVGREIQRAMPGLVPMDGQCWLPWAFAAARRPDEAARALEEARAIPDLARWHGRPVLVAAADALLAGDVDGVDRAVAAATGHMPLDIAVMRVVGAEVADEGTRARWLREALDIYEAAGASFEADRTRAALRRAGGAVPRRKRASGTVPDGLAQHGVTSREVEVLRLVGEGLPNAEIGRRLYVSVRTVEAHVSSLLNKLGVQSRGQLTALSASITYD
jgi:DNA-binding CsgD family transcriptional regulator/tetratricopeptide (TPR) repeat protein